MSHFPFPSSYTVPELGKLWGTIRHSAMCALRNRGEQQVCELRPGVTTQEHGDAFEPLLGASVLYQPMHGAGGPREFRLPILVLQQPAVPLAFLLPTPSANPGRTNWAPNRVPSGARALDTPLASCFISYQ